MSSTPFVNINPDYVQQHSFIFLNKSTSNTSLKEVSKTANKAKVISKRQNLDNFSMTSLPRLVDKFPSIPSSSCENNSLKVSFSKYHVTKPNQAGYNKIYKFRRSRSFLFELADLGKNTNKIHLKIHTNDYHMKVPLFLTKKQVEF
ncbi:hypothetical protein C1646_771031 [Rhizophagus diaphanus]|nr:hypothetical protein C1646_771031 [Rhizophagus diaphanus] [Rhizophagus sp. MUCL 43196]